MDADSITAIERKASIYAVPKFPQPDRVDLRWSNFLSPLQGLDF
jgi:hypothetical protein